jgi:hypothetical protein
VAHAPQAASQFGRAHLGSGARRSNTSAVPSTNDVTTVHQKKALMLIRPLEVARDKIRGIRGGPPGPRCLRGARGRGGDGLRRGAPRGWPAPRPAASVSPRDHSGAPGAPRPAASGDAGLTCHINTSSYHVKASCERRCGLGVRPGCTMGGTRLPASSCLKVSAAPPPAPPALWWWFGSLPSPPGGWPSPQVSPPWCGRSEGQKASPSLCSGGASPPCQMCKLNSQT